MNPNELWDDFALTRQFDAIERRLAGHEDTLTGLSHFPVDIARAALGIEHLTAEIADARREIATVARQNESMRTEWRETIDSRQRSRTLIVAAIITGCFTVLAALVALTAALLGAA